MRLRTLIGLGLAGLGALLAPAAAVCEPSSSLIPGGEWSGPYWGASAGVAAAGLSNLGSRSDVALSGHWGYGLNLSLLYIGGELDGTWGGSTTGTYVAPLVYSTVKVDWSATARARVGLSLGPALVYATGGAAWSMRSVGLQVSGVPLSSHTEGTLGTVIGAGIEIKALPNLALRVEALNYNFSNPSLSLSQVPQAVLHSPLKGGDDTVIRAGLSLRFN